MKFHPAGLLLTAAFGVMLWLAVDVRWAVAIATATLVLDWITFEGALGLTRRD